MNPHTRILAGALGLLAAEHGAPNRFYFWEISNAGGPRRIVAAGIAHRRPASLVAAMAAAGLGFEFHKRGDGPEDPAAIEVWPLATTGC